MVDVLDMIWHTHVWPDPYDPDPYLEANESACSDPQAEVPVIQVVEEILAKPPALVPAALTTYSAGSPERVHAIAASMGQSAGREFSPEAYAALCDAIPKAWVEALLTQARLSLEPHVHLNGVLAEASRVSGRVPPSYIQPNRPPCPQQKWGKAAPFLMSGLLCCATGIGCVAAIQLHAPVWSQILAAVVTSLVVGCLFLAPLRKAVRVEQDRQNSYEHSRSQELMAAQEEYLLQARQYLLSVYAPKSTHA